MLVWLSVTFTEDACGVPVFLHRLAGGIVMIKVSQAMTGIRGDGPGSSGGFLTSPATKTRLPIVTTRLKKFLPPTRPPPLT